jgi:hypothetical protein
MLLALLNVITKYFYLQEVEEFSLIYFCLMGVVGIHITSVICIPYTCWLLYPGL